MKNASIIQVVGLIIATLITTITGATWLQIQKSTHNQIRLEAELVAIQADIKEIKVSGEQFAIMQQQLAVLQQQNEQFRERLSNLEQH
ncbi:MAG: hypothetical protein AAGA60_32920 [Cyanobacteria bacterium P01_E01_bin.42]